VPYSQPLTLSHYGRLFPFFSPPPSLLFSMGSCLPLCTGETALSQLPSSSSRCA
jgi:hypothetical protein